MANYTAITATTKKNLQLDAGALFKGFVVGTDTYASAVAANKLIGATQGGSTFSAVPEARLISVDGVKGPTKGYEIFDSWTVTLTCNLKEVTADAVKLALGSTIAPTSVTSYTGVQPSGDVLDSDYVTNIVWCGKLTGSSLPIIIELDNVLALGGLNFQVQDKNEGVVPLVLTAHYNPTDLDAVPFKIYMPAVS